LSDRVIVLGAGLAGLSAAHHLDGRCEVFEKENAVGGHSRSHAVGGFLFDEGAHVFFGKGACADRFVKQPLADELAPHRAEIWNNYGEKRYGRYPVQANAHALPPELATRCVVDFIAAAQQPERPVSTYEEWCRASFGTAFSEEFMLRYARKIWTVEPSELNTEWLGSSAGGRISRPSLEQVVRGAIDANPQALNYLTEFAYPKTGGFGRIAEPLAAGVRGVRLGCAVTRIEATARRITFSDGTVRSYDAAIATIPLPALVRLIEDAPDEVRAAARRLRCTSVRCVNLGVDRPDVGPGHWCYFYDPEIPFFRVSFPTNLSRGNAPEGRGSIQCEIAYSREKPLNELDLIGRVIDALRRTGVLRDSDKVLVADQKDIPHAYVIFDFERAASLQVIHAWMESVGLYPCGRFGEWGYHWSFEAMESGQRVAARVAEHLGFASMGQGVNCAQS
jgi:protoporphyrinogen oxidase